MYFICTAESALHCYNGFSFSQVNYALSLLLALSASDKLKTVTMVTTDGSSLRMRVEYAQEMCA
jgi:phage-related holin